MEQRKMSIDISVLSATVCTVWAAPQLLLTLTLPNLPTTDLWDFLHKHSIFNSFP